MRRFLAVGLTVAMLGVTCTAPGLTTYASEVEPEVTQESEAVQDTEGDSGTGGEEIEVPDVQTETESDGGDQMNLPEKSDDTEQESEEKVPSIVYSTHVQKIGWQSEVKDGELAGTSGKALRMEGMKIHLENVEEGKGSIEYSAHVQKIGWQDFVSEGELSGTSGRSLRVEAIKIRLTGELAEEYDVYYSTHIQSYGWLGWAKNGAPSGSMGKAKRMEALKIKLVKKGEDPNLDETNSCQYNRIAYQAHSQSFGWLSNVYDDAIGGVTGKSKRLEALKISLPEQEYPGGVEYRTFVQTYGWQDWKSNGELAGTSGQSKRIEAIEIRLTGEMAEHFDVYYSVHMAKIGWSAYAKSGETAGSTDLSKKIEAIKIQLVKKDVEKAPNTEGITFIQGLKNTDFSYNGNIEGTGIVNPVSAGEILGTVGISKRLESLAIYVNNDASKKPQGGGELCHLRIWRWLADG